MKDMRAMTDAELSRAILAARTAEWKAMQRRRGMAQAQARLYALWAEEKRRANGAVA